MNNHVNDWLEAYHDGELKGRRLALVETHLSECEACKRELVRLMDISAILQESPPAGDLMSPERFVSQVGLLLPRKPSRQFRRQVIRRSWQWVPVGFLGVWVFLQTVFIVAGGFKVAQRFGFGGSVVASLMPSQQGGIFSDAGMLILDFLGVGGSFGLGVTMNLLVPGAVGFICLLWLTGWWASQPRQQFENGNS